MSSADPVSADPPGEFTPNVDAPRSFPCESCGAAMTYPPGARHLKCPYCGAENDIPEDAEDHSHLKENDYLAGLVEEDKRRESNAAPIEAVHCRSCGAASCLSDQRASTICPYCGSPLADQNRTSMRLNVQALLPFGVEREKALQIYREWIGSRWFAPNDFLRRATRQESLSGIYMPYWTYDADTMTAYRGERGERYFVTESYTTTVDGKRVTRTRTVPKMRWWPASGRVNVSFDDVLVPGSHSVPPKMADRLAPWPLKTLRPFAREYLAGYVTETYQVDLRSGFSDAQQRMQPEIDRAICRDIGGDAQRIHSKSSEYANITYKHVLLPVWLSAYAYNQRTFRFIVNAQTGAITGERPWSVWKITLAVLAGLATVVALFALFQS